jgi:hypothetical protein
VVVGGGDAATSAGGAPGWSVGAGDARSGAPATGSEKVADTPQDSRSTPTTACSSAPATALDERGLGKRSRPSAQDARGAEQQRQAECCRAKAHGDGAVGGLAAGAGVD